MQLFNSLLFMLNEMSPYILLGFFIAGLMHAFIPRRTMARHLSGRGFSSVFKAAMIGVPLPLCSCGVLPTAIGMRRSGASKAASTSFLISTPQTGVDSIAATWSLLGPAFAVVRPVAALVTALCGGMVVGRWEKSPQDSSEPLPVEADTEPVRGFFGKLKDALQYGFVDLVGGIGRWLVVGLIVAAIITVYVPEDFFSILGSTPILSMLVVLLIAIPMYVCATGSIPIALSLIMKGLSPGTAFVLLMAGPAANFASFTLISKEMGRRSASIYLGSIIAGAIGFGLLIDYLLPSVWFMPSMMHSAACHGGAADFSLFSTICSVALVGLLLFSLVKRYLPKHKISSDMTKQYVIKGMNCPHCQAAVTKSILSVNGVKGVDVVLSTGVATVEGEHNPAEIKSAVEGAGFELA